MLIVTGTIAYDYIMDFPGSFGDHILPNEIHKINLSFIVNKFAKRRGGTAGNVSYSLGLLQIPHKLFSVAGSDFPEFKKRFDELHIDISSVKISKNNYTATGFAMTDKNNNQIWGYFYGAAEETPQLQLKTIAKKNDLVLIGPAGAAGSMSMVKQCVDLGISYMFDPGFILTQVNDDDLTLGVTHADYIIGNDYEIELIKSRVKNWKSLFGSKIIITTFGEKGAEILDNTKKYVISTAPVKKIVDPTGAGDAWRSGFLAGLAKKFDVQTCGQMGAVAASYVLESYGTQEHVYTVLQFRNRYRQAFKSVLML